MMTMMMMMMIYSDLKLTALEDEAFWIIYIVAGVCICNPDSTSFYELILEEAYHCTVFLLQQYGFILVNSC